MKKKTRKTKREVLLRAPRPSVLSLYYALPLAVIGGRLFGEPTLGDNIRDAFCLLLWVVLLPVVIVLVFVQKVFDFLVSPTGPLEGGME